MSERLRSSSVSNEDIIDDLTKNLKCSLNTDCQEETNRYDSNCINGSIVHSEVVDDNHSVLEQLCSNEETEIETNYEPSEKTESDSESIHEVSLKDEELEWTDDQKAERQIIAEQLKVAGNIAFRNTEYKKSIEKYTEALRVCPLQFTQQRSILYCNRSAAKMKLEKYKDAIRDCSKSIELDDKYLKAYYRRAQSYEATKSFDECLADFKKILELDPSHREAASGVIRLPPLIEERNEELKKEMLGKLKDLGNMILRPFGLSTENFKVEQDPASKEYKINFNQ